MVCFVFPLCLCLGIGPILLSHFYVYMHGLAARINKLSEWGVCGSAVAVTASILHPNCSFYRAMHYSAKRGLAIACRPSVCL